MTALSALSVALVPRHGGMAKLKSWKTTVGGVMIALGSVMVQVSAPEWIPTAGASLVALGGLITGVSARDNGVTSKEAGAEK